MFFTGGGAVLSGEQIQVNISSVVEFFYPFFVPCRGSKGRSVWFFVHWMLGTTVSLLGVLNIYTGLQAYHEKTSRSIRLWTILFTTEMSFIAFFYLLQDKWVYTKKQGVILGDEPIRPVDQNISPSDTQKELMVKPCWGRKWTKVLILLTRNYFYPCHPIFSLVFSRMDYLVFIS